MKKVKVVPGVNAFRCPLCEQNLPRNKQHKAGTVFVPISILGVEMLRVREGATKTVSVVGSCKHRSELLIYAR